MTLPSLLFCLLVAVATAQQWEDYDDGTDSADYNSPSDYNDYR